MKISIVQGAFLPVPAIQGGAVERVWHGLGQAFAKCDHEVTHYGRSYPGLLDNNTENSVKYHRVKGYEAPHAMWKLKLRDLRYSLRVKKELRPADIIVTHTFWLPILLRSDRLGKVCVNVQRFPKGQMRFYQHVARLQAVSSATQKAIIEQCPAVAGITKVLPNHLGVKWFEHGSVDFERKQQILYVGRVHPEKGLQLLLDSFSRVTESHKTVELVVVGPSEVNAGGGGATYQAKLKSFAAENNLNVNWVGPEYNVDRLLQYYDEASIFVYPSLAEKGETFGVAPLEAMARGCLTIVSDLDCFQDFAKENENCFVFKRGHEPEKALANAMQRALLLKEANILREKARSAAANFHIDKVAQLYLSDFNSLIN